MAKNYLLEYSEQLATEIEMLCRNIKAPSNTIFQIRKSSSSVYANICEANYGQSKADMLSKFEIALKECSETEGWLKLLFNTKSIDEGTYKSHRNWNYQFYLLKRTILSVFHIKNALLADKSAFFAASLKPPLCLPGQRGGFC